MKPTPTPGTAGALSRLEHRLDGGDLAVAIPRRESFRQFLEMDARVPSGGGHHGPYTFEGREALLEVVATIDRVLADCLPDARLALAGGAQFGKSLLELFLAAYATSQAWRNFGLYLPDDDLVQGMVDTKFRPDVVDQIEWFAQATQIGKAVNRSGRQVNRKGAFLVTDGRRTSSGMIRGLGKVPTTFTMDMAVMDEVDDIEPRMAKFVEGRLTSSNLRMILQVGTQRVHGRGQNKAWKDGSQGVVMLRCGACRSAWNPEEEFPGIVRLAIGAPAPADPQLGFEGTFRRGDVQVAGHDPANRYYLGCPKCGAALDRTRPRWEHRQPQRIRQHHWSFRISQLGIGAIDLGQIVRAWVEALADDEKMIVFRCDRLALPRSATQALTPEILDRARSVDSFDLSPPPREGTTRVAGMDTGDRCWFVARELGALVGRRMIAVEQIPAARMVERAARLCAIHKVALLCIDQRPEVTNARLLALRLNGLDSVGKWPSPPGGHGECHITLPGGITFRRRGGVSQWRGIRCALVSFGKRSIGAGVEHDLDIFDGPDGRQMFVPLLVCNRFETIDRVVREFLTPAEGVQEVVDGAVRQLPAIALPRRQTGSPPILQALDEHFLVGSEREKMPDGTAGDYVDGCENHLLLADAYSGLAELIAPSRNQVRLAADRVRFRRREGRTV